MKKYHNPAIAGKTFDTKEEAKKATKKPKAKATKED